MLVPLNYVYVNRSTMPFSLDKHEFFIFLYTSHRVFFPFQSFTYFVFRFYLDDDVIIIKNKIYAYVSSCLHTIFIVDDIAWGFSNLITQENPGTLDLVGRLLNPLIPGHRILSGDFRQNLTISTIFLSYPTTGFHPFRSNSYSQSQSDPIFRFRQIQRDSGPSGIRNRSELIVLDDLKFQVNLGTSDPVENE